MKRIFVPQLAIVEFKLHDPQGCKKQLETLSDDSFFSSYDEISNNGVFYKLFPKCGGRLLLEDTEYVFKPPTDSQSRPKVRLILAVPTDYVCHTGAEG
ncbi:unnamed protein product [Toxocara canis]|uniref:E2F_CC-MB domain-containing protein n=1 Tax=Toxocara canis TaxID=6265 RepID=A0A183VBQ8_TOXCA|nr:unnamed protein product [Toxocara canis]